MYNLAVKHYDGDGVELDKTKAMKLYNQAADLGHENSKSILSLIRGRRADACILSDQINESENPESKLVIEDITEDQETVNSPPLQIQKEVINTTESNAYTQALYNLARLHHNGEGADLNKSKASDLYSQAAEQGHIKAMFNLALMYLHCDGVELNKPKATELLIKAAKGGHAKAQNQLALMYQNGDSVDKDGNKAIELYQKSIEQGNADAMFNLASIYISQECHSSEEVISLLSCAVEKGHLGAMNQLALMYEYGNGVDINKHKSAELYRLIIESGVGKTENNLVDLYDDGQ